ncbi:hypothetical protein [Maricaulis sp.]|uniref:hypothetical protein n=1 Tax=Maricaulis sp. TaxID=1486257 RepID=UPI002B26C530|nr:hypothetical protein [Maricaulis sp.]
MKHVLWTLAVGLALTCCPAAHADDAVDPMDLVRALDSAWQASDWTEAQSAGETLLAHDRVSFMPEGYRAGLHFQVGLAYAATGDHAQSEAHWAQAEALGTPREEILSEALPIAVRREDGARALAIYRALDADFPDARNALSSGQLNDIIDSLHGAGDHAAEGEALELMVAGYTSDNPFDHGGALHYRRIRHLTQAGEIDAAMALLPEMTSASGARRLRVLNQFAPLWQQPEFSALTDPRAETLDLLARSVADSEAHPDHIEPITDQMSYLVDLGRHAAASELAAAAWRRMQSGDTFEDAGDYTSWLLDRWGHAELTLGRIAFGRATLETASRRVEEGGANVSQLINLAYVDLAIGDDQAVLDRLSLMENRGASEYGWLQVHLARACAAHRLGEPDKLAPSLAFSEDHRALDRDGYFDLLLCQDRDEDAAAFLLERLGDPAQAEDVLMRLQPYDTQYPSEYFPAETALREARDRIIARPDVQAAIARIGRLEHIRMHD